MTKKDYELIAKAFELSKPTRELWGNDYPEVNQGWRNCVAAVTQKMKEDNSRFKRDLFLKACGWQSCL